MIAERVDGKKPTRGNAPKDGYQLRCQCGWEGGNIPYWRDCYDAHKQHVHDISETACLSCGKEISPDWRMTRYGRRCEDCYKKKRKQEVERAKQKGTYDLSRRSATLKMKYGLSVESLDLMMQFQRGECLICFNHLDGSKKGGLHVDHCHDTGVIRGILCSKCNQGLGMFCDDPAILRRAADYIETYPASRYDKPIPTYGKPYMKEKKKAA